MGFWGRCGASSIYLGVAHSWVLSLWTLIDGRFLRTHCWLADAGMQSWDWVDCPPRLDRPSFQHRAVAGSASWAKKCMNILFVSSDSFPSQTHHIFFSPEAWKIISKESLLKSYYHLVTTLLSCTALFYHLPTSIIWCVYLYLLCFFFLNIPSFLRKWMKVVKKQALWETSLK